MLWLGGLVEYRYPVLMARSAGWRTALLELVFGQLLASCRLFPAMKHLDAGFAAASGFLSPDDYFNVMKRHDLLRLLPLFPEPRAARALDELLVEARVIRRLPSYRAGSAEIRDHGTDIPG